MSNPQETITRATLEPAGGGLRGTFRVPGDKSITHRLVLASTLNAGKLTIENPSSAHDCLRSLELVRAVGCQVSAGSDIWRIDGADRAAHTDIIAIDCGNSGTTARIGMGALCAEHGRYVLIGDDSLSARPMDRVVDPLGRIGATISSTDGRLPVTIEGHGPIRGGDTHGVIAVASAQVHAALAFAGLRSHSGVALMRVAAMRDHTLRLLRALGAPVRSESDHLDTILPATLSGDHAFSVPGDFSSATFLVAAAALVPDSELTISDVGLNGTRTAFIDVLRQMGADVHVRMCDDEWEPRGELRAAFGGRLKAIELDMSSSPYLALMLDELPLLALVATQAHGRTIVRGASELRVKETDRIAATVSALRAFGASVDELPDGFVIQGSSHLRGGAIIDPRGDHRIAMMAAVAALAADGPTEILNPDCVAVSWPGFRSALQAATGTVGFPG